MRSDGVVADRIRVGSSECPKNVFGKFRSSACTQPRRRAVEFHCRIAMRSVYARPKGQRKEDKRKGTHIHVK